VQTDHGYVKFLTLYGCHSGRLPTSSQR